MHGPADHGIDALLPAAANKLPVYLHSSK
jgi:hypothetical protein